MTVAIIRFGGSNCDRDALQALTHLDIAAEIVWFEDGLPGDVTGVMLPGGFSYGDYLRAGSMAARTPIIEEITEAVGNGIPLLGVCNGAQIGCEASLIPGTFTVNSSAKFQCERVNVRVEKSDTPWTNAYDRGDVLELPIAHGEGRYQVSDVELSKLRREDRILFRYCDENGEIHDEANPNGSSDNVAGVIGSADNIAVLMPHPERSCLPDINGTDGQGILCGFSA